jgi:soluble lytic murein transglycosylase-like protein
MGIDASLPLQNIQGGVGYLKKLLNQYGGNKELALEHYYGSRDAAANAAYAQRVMAKEGDEYHINVTVNARTNADPKEIADTVWKAMESRLKNRVQRNLAEAVTTGWAFGGGGG